MSRSQPLPPRVPRSVLVDSSAFFVLANQQDKDHPAARRLLEALLVAGTKLLTTNFILAETQVLILARTRRIDKAVAFLNDAYASNYVSVVRVTAADEQTALAILKGYHDKAFSFTGALSFAVTERLDVRHAFTLDADFGQYGWTVSVLAVRGESTLSRCRGGARRTLLRS
jgi:predicted nucleic acid-binding protein